MGRQPNVPQLTKAGTYRCWHPSIKKYVNLGTSDFEAACSIQAGFYGRKSLSSQPAEPPAPESGATPLGNPAFPYSGGSSQMIDLEDDKPIDANDLLASWNKAKDNDKQPVPPPATSATSATPSTSFPGFALSNVPKAPPGPGKAKPGLTPEQSAKLASGLKKTVANLNVIIVGAGVQMFGRVPAPLDDEEVALLQMGWEMYIDEMFAKAKIKPWHLLIAGNVMIAAAMYVGGTPIPRKPQLPSDPGKAKSATVTPLKPEGGNAS